MIYGRHTYASKDAWASDNPGFLFNKSSSFQDLSGNHTSQGNDGGSWVTDTVTFGNDTRANTAFCG